MSTILDALNKYKKERTQREGRVDGGPGGRFLDGDSGGGGSQPPDSGGPPFNAPQPPRRSIALLTALIGLFLIVVVAAGAWLYHLINQQNQRITETAQLAQQRPSVITVVVTPVPTPTPEPTAVPTPSPEPTPEPTPEPSPEPARTPPPPVQGQATAGAATSHVEPGDIGLKIDGIMWDIRNPAAIVNGKIVSVGDLVDGFKVMKINRDSIEVTKGVIMYKVQFGN